jgi:glycosyltransferase involved in cell wall biosynthesis
LGRLDPYHKGLDILLEAFAQTRNDLRHAALVIVGPDHKGKRSFLENLSQELGIEDQVIFAGPKYGMEKYEILYSADVFVHTSRYEAAIPFSVLEAMAVGKPCLIAEAICFGDFFRKHVVGLQVKASRDQIAEGLVSLCSMPDSDILRMGYMARQSVLQEFSWERTATILTETCKRTLAV